MAPDASFFRELFSVAVAVRALYSVLLVAISLFLLREVWFLWSTKAMTFGRVTYYDRTKLDDGAASRIRHLIQFDYAHTLRLLEPAPPTGNPNLLSVEKYVDTSILPKGLEAFQHTGIAFAELDISFQGLDIKKMFSSFRTYLSPAVDLNLVISRATDAEIRATVQWPREGRTLRGRMKRFEEYELGPYADDRKVAQRVACYLIWLQTVNERELLNTISLDEFCEWVEGLRILEKLREPISPKEKEIAAASATKLVDTRLVEGITVNYYYPDNYRVLADIVDQLGLPGADDTLTIPAFGKTAKIDRTLFADLMRYFYLTYRAHFQSPYLSHLGSDSRTFARTFSVEEFSSRFKDLVARSDGKITETPLALALFSDRVIPWKKIRSDLISSPQVAATPDPGILTLEAIVAPPEPRPNKEVGALLRKIPKQGSPLRWTGTAFLVKPDTAITFEYGSKTNEDQVAAVERVNTAALAESQLTFERVDVREAITLVEHENGRIVALKLARPFADVVPYKLAASSTSVQDGLPVYIVGFFAFDPRVSPEIQSALFGAQFEVPAYVRGTVLRAVTVDGHRQFVYDAYTLGGSGGAPVIDARTGEVVGINVKGTQYGNFAKLGVGVGVQLLTID